MKNMPKELLTLVGQELLRKFLPRFSPDGAIQVACPNYTPKERLKREKQRGYSQSYWYQWKPYTAFVYHRMKVHLGDKRWWCASCRRSGPLTSLPAFIEMGEQNGDNKLRNLVEARYE